MLSNIANVKYDNKSSLLDYDIAECEEVLLLAHFLTTMFWQQELRDVIIRNIDLTWICIDDLHFMHGLLRRNVVLRFKLTTST